MKINKNPSGISLHYEKHKGNDAAVNGLQRHNERKPGQKHSNKNIKDERTAENVFLRRSPKKYKAEIEDKIKQNKKGGMKGVRKNSVRLVEATVQLSGKILEQPEEKQEEVLQDMYEWLKEEHGEENIVSAVIHKDETNMHLHFDFVPITEDKRLSARDIISKGNMKRMQRESLEYMQEKYKSMNFERGNSETKGLSQKDFEKFKKLQEEHEQAMNEYSDMLDVQENELDKREEAITEKEAELNGKAYKLRNLSNTVKNREKNVTESEKILETKEKQYKNEYKALQSEKETFNKTVTQFNQQQTIAEPNSIKDKGMHSLKQWVLFICCHKRIMAYIAILCVLSRSLCMPVWLVCILKTSCAFAVRVAFYLVKYTVNICQRDPLLF